MSLSDILKDLEKSLREKLDSLEEPKPKAKELTLQLAATTLTGVIPVVELSEKMVGSLSRTGREEEEEVRRPEAAGTGTTAETSTAEPEKPARREPVIFAPRPAETPEGTTANGGKTRPEPVIFAPAKKEEPAAKEEVKEPEAKAAEAAAPEVKAEPEIKQAEVKEEAKEPEAKAEPEVKEPEVKEAEAKAEPAVAEPEPKVTEAAKAEAPAVAEPAKAEEAKPEEAAKPETAKPEAAEVAKEEPKQAEEPKPAEPAKPAATEPAEPVAAEAGEGGELAKAAKVTEEAKPEDATQVTATEGAAAPKATTLAEPLPGYAALTIASLRARMRGKSAEQIRELLEYEKATQGREAVVRMFENRLAKLQAEQDKKQDKK